MQRTVTKIVIYPIAVALMYSFGKIFSVEFLHLSNITAGLIALIELISIFENFYKITNEPIFKKIIKIVSKKYFKLIENDNGIIDINSKKGNTRGNK